MSEKRVPSAWWFAVAAVVFVLGLVPLALAITNAVSGLVEYELHDFDEAQATELTVDGGQVAIFTTYEGAGTISCNGGPGTDVPDPSEGDQATVTTLDVPDVSVEYSRGSQSWHRVAVTPEEWDDGTYSVICNVVSTNGNPSPAAFAYADNPAILSTVVGFVVALGIAGLATILALVIVIVVGVKRHRATRPPYPTYPQFPPNPPPPPSF